MLSQSWERFQLHNNTKKKIRFLHFVVAVLLFCNSVSMQSKDLECHCVVQQKLQNCLTLTCGVNPLWQHVLKNPFINKKSFNIKIFPCAKQNPPKYQLDAITREMIKLWRNDYGLAGILSIHREFKSWTCEFVCITKCKSLSHIMLFKHLKSG